MELSVIVLIVLSITGIAIYQVIRNRNQPSADDGRRRMLPWVMALTGLAVLSDIISCAVSSPAVIVDLMPGVIVLWLLTSSIWEYQWIGKAAGILIAFRLVVTAYHLGALLNLFPEPGRNTALVLLVFMNAVLVSCLVYGFIVCLRDVKAVMKSGTVWFAVSLMVDMVYLIFIIASSALWQIEAVLPALFLMGGILVALGIRIMTDSLFLLWRKQERIIAESMKVTSVAAVVDESRIDDVYKDLYERVKTYFETEKPYLNGELTINDMVKALYSNKLYISRAISQFTGRNFCQFVNYYRVMHSIECFRNNPDLKVHELGSMSGFNTIVSFNMAFRLFMGENPSDWCRRERSRIIKKKK
jgi:AraC-like DNA-binding protein